MEAKRRRITITQHTIQTVKKTQSRIMLPESYFNLFSSVCPSLRLLPVILSFSISFVSFIVDCSQFLSLFVILHTIYTPVINKKKKKKREIAFYSIHNYMLAWQAQFKLVPFRQKRIIVKTKYELLYVLLLPLQCPGQI